MESSFTPGLFSPHLFFFFLFLEEGHLKGWAFQRKEVKKYFQKTTDSPLLPGTLQLTAVGDHPVTISGKNAHSKLLVLINYLRLSRTRLLGVVL